MPGEAHVYFTAFSSGSKALVMFCVCNSGADVISWRATCLQILLVKTVLERKVKYDFLRA